MFNSTQMAAGLARLVDDKLTAADVKKIVPVLRRVLDVLETTYGYTLAESLAGLTGTDAQTVAAAVIEMEDLGFSIAELSGGRDGIKFKESDQHREYAIEILAVLGPLPSELGSGDLKRIRPSGRKSGQMITTRYEGWR